MAVSYTHLDVYKRQDKDGKKRWLLIPFPTHGVFTVAYLKLIAQSFSLLHPLINAQEIHSYYDDTSLPCIKLHIGMSLNIRAFKNFLY